MSTNVLNIPCSPRSDNHVVLSIPDTFSNAFSIKICQNDKYQIAEENQTTYSRGSSKSSEHCRKSKWSLIRKFITSSHYNTEDEQFKDRFLRKYSVSSAVDKPFTIDPETSTDALWDSNSFFVLHDHSLILFYWLLLLSIVVLYDCWCQIARQAFDYKHEDWSVWLILNTAADFCYIFDIIVQCRTGYLQQGLIVCNAKKLVSKYALSRKFLADLFALLPLSLLCKLQSHYSHQICHYPLLRFPRFVKIYRVFKFYRLVENRISVPNFWRILNMMHVLLFCIHWFACFYNMISNVTGDGNWSFSSEENSDVLSKYLHAYYWATMALTTVGDLQRPETPGQFLFTITCFLLGVLFFATLVGQMGSVIENKNYNRQEFERLLDGAKSFMSKNGVPHILQNRVKQWYDYSWSQGLLDSSIDVQAIAFLPTKLRAELAIYSYLNILKKIPLFQETGKCEPEFLHDLVLKMKIMLVTPGDYVCRIGEIANEMYIIADGFLELVDEFGESFGELQNGQFFGEIGILSCYLSEDVHNKRTASVKSLGYSQLFAINKNDVLELTKKYPKARMALVEFARDRMSKNIDKSRRSSNGNSRKSSLCPSSIININVENFSSQCTNILVEGNELIENLKQVLKRIELQLEANSTCSFNEI